MIVKENYTKPLRNLLKEGGVWMNFSNEQNGTYKTAFQLLRFVYCLGIWASLLFTFYKQGVQFLFTPAAMFIPLGGVLLSTSCIVIVQGEKIEYLVDQCEVILSSFKKDWEVAIIKSYIKNLVYYINLGKMVFLSFSLLYIFLPLIIDGIRAVVGYENPYYLPLPLEGFLDKNVKRTAFYYLILLLSNVWFLVAIMLTNAIEGIIFFIVVYNIILLQIIRTCVKRLHKVKSEQNDVGVLLLPDWDLREITRYHRKIIRLNILQNKCITSPYIMQNLTSTLSNAYILFSMRQLLGENSMILFLCATFILMVVVLLFIVCFAGEFIQSESKELFYELYNMPWYRQRPTVRKDVLLIMTQLSKPLLLDYKHNVLNLSAFKQTMNNTYSFFMLMISVEP